MPRKMIRLELNDRGRGRGGKQEGKEGRKIPNTQWNETLRTKSKKQQVAETIEEL